MIITTTNDLPGYNVDEVMECFGLTGTGHATWARRWEPR